MRGHAICPWMLLVALAGCEGVVISHSPSAESVEGEPPAEPTTGDPAEPGEFARDDDPFALDRETPRLLPFEIRLARVAEVAGVDTDDALLAGMRGQAVSLGGYDHSRGVLPDSSWTATRIAGWMRALRPVCTSDVMRTRYPELPGADLGALIQSAWGRPATEADIAEIADAVIELPEGAQRETICLIVLSASEAVLQ